MSWKFLSEEDMLDFSDVLIVPQRSKLVSRADVKLERDFHLPISGRVLSGFPVMCANMSTVGTLDTVRVLVDNGAFGVIYKFFDLDECAAKFTASDFRDRGAFMSIGTSAEDIERLNKLEELLGGTVENICIDVANGHRTHFEDFLRNLRAGRQNACIMAGNVATPEGVLRLLAAGADIVKVGIGSGAACTTRAVTGIGVPQLSAVLECADAAHSRGGLVISDGGCQQIGDISKAFCAGADFVMLGYMFAGAQENSSENEGEQGAFFGMSSDLAMRTFYGERADYRAAEGREVKVMVSGSTLDRLNEIGGGVRSCATYIGAKSVEEFFHKGRFVRVNRVLNEVAI